jgi:hypothetical protein
MEKGERSKVTESLKTLLYETIHRNTKPAAQLADETGISYSYLCRAGLPTDESGVKFPLEHLIPLMKAANDYSVLKHLNAICGFMSFRVPRGFADKRDEKEAVSHYQQLCATSVNCLLEFFRSPSPKGMKAVNQSLADVMEYAATLNKRIANFRQLELEL